MSWLSCRKTSATEPATSPDPRMMGAATEDRPGRTSPREDA
jgi:hypothetical protein